MKTRLGDDARYKDIIETLLVMEDEDSVVEILSGVQFAMGELLIVVDRVLRENAPSITLERARAYWLSHIAGALGGDYSSHLLGRSMITLEDAIEEIEGSEDCK